MKSTVTQPLLAELIGALGSLSRGCLLLAQAHQTGQPGIIDNLNKITNIAADLDDLIEQIKQKNW